MSKVCVFRSPDPMIKDGYKFPELRYVCRCVARLKDMKEYNDRFVGDDVCENCPHRKESEKD